MNYEFNFDELTIGDFTKFMVAGRANDVVQMAEVIQKFTNTEIDLLPMTEWAGLSQQFVDAIIYEFKPQGKP